MLPIGTTGITFFRENREITKAAEEQMLGDHLHLKLSSESYMYLPRKKVEKQVWVPSPNGAMKYSKNQSTL